MRHSVSANRFSTPLPAGFNEHKTPLPEAERALMDITAKVKPSKRLAADARGPKAARQLGTLGGGNHFLELLYDEEGGIWIMLHSGSRNIGLTPPMLHACSFVLARGFFVARDSCIEMQQLNNFIKQ